MFNNINWLYFAIQMFVLIVSITIHELAHAKSAESSGDDTARQAGRISLNPLDHLDPVGTFMMIFSSLAGVGIGWAKPVPINPSRFRHPRWDSLKCAAWGPISNLIIAFIAGMIIRFAGGHLNDNDFVIAMYFVVINIGLAVFNLIPIAPLDGSHILSSLLPVDQARKYDIFMMRYGFMILLALVMMPGILGFSPLGMVLGPPRKFLFTLLTGHSY